MPPIAKEAWDALLRDGCDRCKRNYLRVRLLASGTIEVMEGDAVSTVTWTVAPEALHERIFRVECSECAALLFSREDCPLCRGAGGLQRALGGNHGMATPRACPRCGFAELTLSVEARLRLETLLGRISRRVLDGEPHEPGFHVVEARCESCEETVAKAGDARCVGCGRSSLLRRMT